MTCMPEAKSVTLTVTPRNWNPLKRDDMHIYESPNHVYGIPKDDTSNIYKCVKSHDYCEVVECSDMKNSPTEKEFISRTTCEIEEEK